LFGSVDPSVLIGEGLEKERFMKRRMSRAGWVVLALLPAWGCGTSTTTPEPAATLPSPPHLLSRVSIADGLTTSVALDPGTGTLYAANILAEGATVYGGDGRLSVIDAVAGTVTGTSPTDSFPGAVSVDPATHVVFLVNTDWNTVSLFDGATHLRIGDVSVGHIPVQAAVDPGTKTVYVLTEDNVVYVIDEVTRQVTDTITVGFGEADVDGGIAVDPTTHTIYAVTQNADTRVAPENASTVTVIDGNTKLVKATIAVGGNPSGIAVDPAARTVYVTNSLDDTLSIIDAVGNRVTATVKVGALPEDVAVDTATHTAYVANRNNRSVSVIDGLTKVVTDTVTVDGLPYAVAVDPATHRVYVADDDTPGGVFILAGRQ
jgi:YVTN family beta-propeller protein